MATNLEQCREQPLGREHALIEAWLAGDCRAGQRLFAHYRPIIKRFVESKNVIDPEEVVQRTLLACVEGRNRLRSAAGFRAYLFATARYCMLAQWRATCRRLDEVDLHPIPQPCLDTLLGQLRRLGQLEAEIERLPEHLRCALQLYYQADLPGAKIARDLEIPEGTVRSRVRHGVQRLRNADLEIAPNVSSTSPDRAIRTTGRGSPSSRRPSARSQS